MIKILAVAFIAFLYFASVWRGLILVADEDGNTKLGMIVLEFIFRTLSLYLTWWAFNILW